MLHKKHFAAALVAAIAAATALTVPASAATREQFLSAARASGIPEVCIQSFISSTNGTEYTPEQYDAMIDALDTYEAQIWDKIEDQFGISQNPVTTTTAGATTTTAPPAGGGQTTVTTTTTAKISSADFIKMTREEKIAYVKSLPKDQQKAFLAGLSTAERNSIIKQLSLEDKSEIIGALIDVGDSMGFHFSVEDITDEQLKLSVRDDEGKLLDTSSMGVVIDETGISRKLPLFGAASAAAAAIAGLFLLCRKMRRDTNA